MEQIIKEAMPEALKNSIDPNFKPSKWMVALNKILA